MLRRHRILQEEVRWRPQKHDSRVPATLVPDGAAPRTPESHPSTLGGLGAHNERFNLRFPLDVTPRPRGRPSLPGGRGNSLVTGLNVFCSHVPCPVHTGDGATVARTAAAAADSGWRWDALLRRVARSRLDPCTGSGTVLFGSGMQPRSSGARPALVSRLITRGQGARML